MSIEKYLKETAKQIKPKKYRKTYHKKNYIKSSLKKLTAKDIFYDMENRRYQYAEIEELVRKRKEEKEKQNMKEWENVLDINNLLKTIMIDKRFKHIYITHPKIFAENIFKTQTPESFYKNYIQNFKDLNEEDFEYEIRKKVCSYDINDNLPKICRMIYNIILQNVIIAIKNKKVIVNE